MIRLDPKRASCLVAWGALLLIPTLLTLAVALPWWQRVHDLDEEIALQRDQLTRLQRLIGTLPGLKAELEHVQANDDVKAFYFDADTPALAGAQLQSEVQEIVRAAGARPISTQVLPVDAADHPPRVRVRVQLQGSTEQLLDMLLRIESARPFLFVDQMSIRSMSSRRANTVRNARQRVRRAAAGPAPGDLTVRLDLSGYTLGQTQ